MTALLEYTGIPRSTYYYHLKKINSPDKYASVKEEISSIYHENQGRYGYRRITLELRKREQKINHKTVRRLMKEMGYGRGYKYAHDYNEAIVNQNHLPDKLLSKRYYTPTSRGFENELAERLKNIDILKKKQK